MSGATSATSAGQTTLVDDTAKGLADNFEKIAGDIEKDIKGSVLGDRDRNHQNKLVKDLREAVKTFKGTRRLDDLARSNAKLQALLTARGARPTAKPGLEGKAEASVSRYVKWAAGLALIPLPLVDLAAITAVQVKMLSELADIYGVKFSDEIARSMITAVAGGVGAGWVAAGAASTLVKMLPGVGTLAGIASLPAAAGVATYAIGKVFIAHFASGGTLLDGDIDRMREHFRRESSPATQG